MVIRISREKSRENWEKTGKNNGIMKYLNKFFGCPELGLWADDLVRGFFDRARIDRIR